MLIIYNLMYSRIIHITLLAVAFILVFSASPSLAQDVSSRHEQDLLHLINQARENPLSVASSLGMDADQILQDFPELKDILINGLPPLSFNENLYAAAGAHTRDMLEHGYYSHTSLDGRTFEERIRASGYVPTATGESLGMLAFFNFIQPAKAVELIFENMFRDELDPARTERRNILAGDLEEVGVAMGTGTLNLSGSLYNVYLATCDFGAGKAGKVQESIIREMELQLLQLINQARANPLGVAASLGMDQDQLLADLPELYDILTEGLPPLGLNEKLSAAARSHTHDMLENNYYSHTSLDGRSFEDRIIESGYDPFFTGESLAVLAFSNFLQPAEAIDIIFEKIFTDELNPSRTEERNILDPDLKEVGLGFDTGILELEKSLCNVYLTTIDFGASRAQELLYLNVTVYQDKNGDGLYNRSEGAPGRGVIVFGNKGLHLKTDNAGGVNTPLDTGGYLVILFSQTEDLKIQEVILEEENRAITFVVDEF